MTMDSRKKEKEIATISLQQSNQMWDQLSEFLEKFYQAWEERDAPAIAEYLPAAPLALRRFVLIELIKVDLECRLQKKLEPVSVCAFVDQFPELMIDGKVDNELLFEEIDLYKRFKHPFSAQVFQKKFPKQAETIRRYIGDEPTRPAQKQLRRQKDREFSAGATIEDFELLLELGKGAFATVFLARQISMQRLVALKISSDHGDEPKTLAQLDCKNIVRVFDVRDIHDPSCRLLYMKFVPGGTLQDVVRECRRVPEQERNGAFFLSVIDAKTEKTGQDVPLDSRTRQRLMRMKWQEVVCWIGAQIGDGLAYAHERNVLHRDLKPANILLTSEGIPQIVDFNVSYCAEVEGASAESFFGGSLAYMSPEQLEAFDPSHSRGPSDLDDRSDLFSLGVIVWELLFGERPYDDSIQDGDYTEIITQLIQQRTDFQVGDRLQPRKASDENLDLSGLFSRLLAPDPEKRFRTAKALAGELNLLSDPRSRNLLRAPETWKSRLAVKGIIPIMVLAVVLPSAFAAIFNYFHNFKSIIEPKQEISEIFQRVQLVINLIAFPVGIGLLCVTGWFLSRRLHTGRSPTATGGGDSVALRKHISRMPLIAAIIPISIWTLAGLAYPIVMYMSGAASLTLGDSLHFLASLILCGMIASVYPFFLVAFISIRYWYPVAFHTEEVSDSDQRFVDRLLNETWWFLSLGVLLPIFAILLMVTTQKESDRDLLAYLAGASFFGLGAIVYLFRKLERHLETLKKTINHLTGAPSDGF